MPTTGATGNRDPPNGCVCAFSTRHNRGVGITTAIVNARDQPWTEGPYGAPSAPSRRAQ